MAITRRARSMLITFKSPILKLVRKEAVLSFLIACIVVSGAVWLFEQSLTRSGSLSTKEHQQPSIAPDIYSAPGKGVEGTANLHSRSPNAGVQAPEKKIFKCIVLGKSIYTDEVCVTKAAQRDLTLSDSAGIVSPSKERAAEVDQRRAAEKAYEQQMAPKIAEPARSHKLECEALDKRIEWLDAMARQPQSGQMQDWLRQERAKATARQFQIHCFATRTIATPPRIRKLPVHRKSL